MSNYKKHHAQWKSNLGFILAAVGSAVGLGNIWKFPYMTGQSGGSAFVLTYLFCIALVGFPILVIEWMIGRRGQKNPINTMSTVAKANHRSHLWAIFGASGVLGAFLILSFYSIIGGWAIKYIFSTGAGTFINMQQESISDLFTNFLANPTVLLFWHTVFMLLTVGIVARGVSLGLEKASKILMPALALILLILVGYGMFTNAFAETLAYLFRPKWEEINGTVFLAALGHAFFTLSLGMGIMLSYGSYLGQEINLFKTARIVVIMDTVIALLAGLAIFPIVFSQQLDPSSGPGLIFVTLPVAFGQMPAGTFLGVLFFLLLTFAALTSSISLLEPVVEWVEEKTPLSRAVSSLFAGALIWLVGIAALLSFNNWSDVMILGNNIFDFLDKLTSKFMLPLTGLGIIIFAAWFMNQKSIQEDLGLSDTQFKIWSILTKYITPLAVIIVFIDAILH